MQRDALGRVEQKTETISGVTDVYVYHYDSTGRLWEVMKNGALAATYLYDANGNRTHAISAPGEEAGTADNQDRLLSYGRWTFSYAASGELRVRPTRRPGL